MANIGDLVVLGLVFSVLDNSDRDGRTVHNGNDFHFLPRRLALSSRYDREDVALGREEAEHLLHLGLIHGWQLPEAHEAADAL